MEYLAIASAAMSAVGAISGAGQQASQYEAYASANQYNAAVLRNRADSTRAAYGQREEQQRRQARFFLGEQRGSVGQSGLGMGGSNADIERQSEVSAELDSLNIRYEGELEAHGLKAQSDLESWQAGVNRSSAGYARSRGFIGAAGSLLSGAGNYLTATRGTFGGNRYSMSSGSFGNY